MMKDFIEFMGYMAPEKGFHFSEAGDGIRQSMAVYDAENQIYTVYSCDGFRTNIVHFNDQGNLHSENHPAVLLYDSLDECRPGIVKLEFWINNGKYHRTDGPAYIDHRSKTGQTIYCYQNCSFIGMDPQDFYNLAKDKDVMEMYINLNPSDEDDDGALADYWRCDESHRQKLITIFKGQGK